ncbi:hypothetical protein GCM10009718_20820 [Isoptericola halotolerans]|uniref:Uncharacterized protein n=1 Tax=Isoptericola halotolerans TaxID=300560 RepID=A0ABX2A8G6_9MICO|nr:hypothetical protein [Isoptericola halotolerans]NOV98985.1 hypothetical protein [Isoptericola halotolerans]
MTEARGRNKTLWAGSTLLGIGTVVWLAGAVATAPDVVAGARFAVAVGCGLLAGAAAQGIARARGRRLPVLAGCAVTGVVAAAAMYPASVLAAATLR